MCLLVLAIGVFVASIVAVIPNPQLPFVMERPALRPVARGDNILPHVNRSFRRALNYADHLWSGRAATSNAPLAIAFYAPWDDGSVASLRRHVNQLDWVIPGWTSITGASHHITNFPDVRGKEIISHASHRPLILPMIQNAIDGEWDGAGMATLLADPRERKRTLGQVEAMLSLNHAGGAFFDFEDLPLSAHANYRAFLAEARARFRPRGWIVAIAVPADDPDWNLKAYADVADKLFLMAYDEHYQGGEPGPIASQRWFQNVVTRAGKAIPPGKLVVAFASYAYDWKKGGDTDALSVEEAWLNARESGIKPVFDRPSGNSTFAYDEQGIRHQVWIADAATAHNQIAALEHMGVHSVALWRLGSEDPSVWTLFGRRQTRLPQTTALQAIPAGTNVDIEGSGEILRIGAVPVTGERTITSGRDGQIIDQRFDRLPSPFQIQRTGYRPGLVALTFDDGPDPTWTPKILDILKAKRVPATFFIVGENGLVEYRLLRRMVNEGHEIGSHTYTHPNLATVSPGETTLELNATQRLFQAFTGHSLRLFRAPYFGDAEPTTTDEILPVAEAQGQGYLSVGLHVDPGDWKRPGAQQIIDRTIEGVEQSSYDRSGNVVLLHDAGGDRAQTVEALPVLIDRLRAKGYRFVAVSTLADLSRDQVMPPISASDRVAARADLYLFLALGEFTVALKWLFLIAITLGILRAILLSALALLQARREQRQIFPAIDPARRVTVLIPAFNEERVIERAVRRVLESVDVNVDVIVIDDGSKDRTSEIVSKTFSKDARVRLLTLENGGKARALNRALELVESEIVIALDADTQFEPATIARLSRWFVDPSLGAVAGNAKVGNRVNLITCWQALEYITAQNLERRAWGILNAITVVPGAVGAWRTETLRTVGGYPADTLAEDQDLTIAIQRAGWKIHYDQFAVAWTEAPESFHALAKQRFRWAYGTLQCLWKHGAIMRKGRPPGLARIGLPQAIVFQILLSAISPIIDLALVTSVIETYFRVQAHGWAQTHTDLERMLTFWLIFSAIDLLSAFIAFALERRERWSLLLLLIPQRIGYRQTMYYVVLKAILHAIRGQVVGWGKLERSGRVSAG
jgi:cellulose synthase/poly-beta-1,6-N-acetylglucosamine synthase-like glycosyltransferase/peptidoglycan/xylan/chitin deacetylase (PgdA/CDA1 family)/spore germination protein YaaH